MDNRLIYEEYKGNKDILIIDLHNNYSIVAIKTWNNLANNYEVEFRLKENTIDKWDLIDELHKVIFNTNYKIINSAILKFVSDKLGENFFDKYINRLEYEFNCFDIGNDYLERNASV